MAPSNILVYLLRRDLRTSDNPIFNALITQKDHGFTHLLPLYIFPSQQIEISGFIRDEDTKSPYPEARSRLGRFWRCGPHRAKFLAESVWDLKSSLEKIGSGLCIRAGMVAEVMNNILEFDAEKKIGAVWMTKEEGVEEERDENDTRLACDKAGVGFELWADEKYLVDEYVSSFPLRLLGTDITAVAIYPLRT
jgi:deoxyribodipyrimidine photo-lyase